MTWKKTIHLADEDYRSTLGFPRVMPITTIRDPMR